MKIERWTLTVERSLFLSVFLLLVTLVAHAFPPAPHHEIYGLARDQWGNPFTQQNAQIILETENGTRITAGVIPNLEPGVNFRLRIPMDAGLTSDRYRASALLSQVPFRIYVRLGTTTYLPIQMQGDYALLGQPAGVTRLDLTLGTDSDGDGLPDAWKDLLIAMSGGGLTRADIRPDDDLDGDGMTNMQEYIAGTYAWDATDNLWLNILGVRDEKILLEFYAINGRTYKIWGSSDLENWTLQRFRLPAIDAAGITRSNYFAPGARRFDVELLQDESENPPSFFRLHVQ